MTIHVLLLPVTDLTLMASMRPSRSPLLIGIEFVSSPNHAQTIRASVRTIPILHRRQTNETQSLLSWVVFLAYRASAIDVKETVICAGVQENGKLPTENEPKIGLSLQNVRTVKVEGFPSLFRASAIDVKETVNDDMCVLISSFNYQCLHFGDMYMKMESSQPKTSQR
ncbi:hypothetical protein F2Q70_00030943 [Brassica cretica]|uniref:Uncharacterized protein n=1 Tax=Brassica cretica TaxID=69181 RepID=A0A8S9FD40_BRACR|nr:hypothetical protein F2Q70_00030943 [Brassica cretica]